MVLRLNRIQRGVAIGTAVIVALIQINGIVANGLEENRGWMWAFLLVAVLLGIGFSSGTDAAPSNAPSLQPQPGPIKGKAPSEEQM